VAPDGQVGMSLIYVVDADPRIVQELTNTLIHDRHVVRAFAAASDLFAAIAVEAPALVLTDLYLRGMQGIEIIMRVAKGEPAIPVIALATHGASQALFVVHDPSHLGAAATLNKPLVGDEVLRTVRRVLGSSS